MGKAKKTRKFSVQKKLLSPHDPNLKKNKQKTEEKIKKEKASKVRNIPKEHVGMFFQYNKSLGPPYSVLVDTNFINFSIQHKIEPIQGMMDCLYAECTPIITDCVLAELEKLGQKYRIALRIAKDPRFERMKCSHKGTYADDCIVERCLQSRCYIVATCDKGLKQRIRKIPGIPIMYVNKHRYTIERLPEAYGAPKV